MKKFYFFLMALMVAVCASATTYYVKVRTAGYGWDFGGEKSTTEDYISFDVSGDNLGTYIAFKVWNGSKDTYIKGDDGITPTTKEWLTYPTASNYSDPSIAIPSGTAKVWVDLVNYKVLFAPDGYDPFASEGGGEEGGGEEGGEDPVEFANVYLRGGMNGWAAADAWKLATTDGVTYTLDCTISAGVEFKVGDASWDTINYGGKKGMATNTDYTLDYNSGTNLTLAADFTGTVIFNTSSHVIRFSVEEEGEDPEPEPDPTSYTVYFNNSVSNWDNIYAYVWNSASNNKVAVWPGVQLENPADNVYTYTFSTNIDPTNIIFNNGGDSGKTSDLTFENGATYNSNGKVEEGGEDPVIDYSRWYVNLPGAHNEWNDNGIHPNAENIAVFTIENFVNNFKVKVWDGSADHGYSYKAELPLDQWITLTEGTYSDLPVTTLPESALGKTVTIKFNVATNQIYAEVEGGEEGGGEEGGGEEGGEEPEPEPTSYTVYFDNSVSNWSNVYAYVWNSASDKKVADWPGTELLNPADNVYTYTFSTAIDPTNIIFNNNDGTQTADFDFVDGETYDVIGIVDNSISRLFYWSNPTRNENYVAEFGTAEAMVDTERVNYGNTALEVAYKTICLSGKRDFSTAYVEVTFTEPLEVGDVIEVTAYRNKDGEKGSNVYLKFSNEAVTTIGGADGFGFVNLNADGDTPEATEPNTLKYVVTENEAGATSMKMTRYTTSTNLFITTLSVYRKPFVVPENLYLINDGAIELTKNGNVFTASEVTLTKTGDDDYAYFWLNTTGGNELEFGSYTVDEVVYSDQPSTIEDNGHWWAVEPGKYNIVINWTKEARDITLSRVSAAGTITVYFNNTVAQWTEPGIVYQTEDDIYDNFVMKRVASQPTRVIARAGSTVWDYNVYQAQIPANTVAFGFYDNLGSGGIYIVDGDENFVAPIAGYVYNPDGSSFQYNEDSVTGVESIEAENAVEAVYYNLQGVRVAAPEAGNIYIEVRGSKVSKVRK